jgi:hypothetical protein
LYPGDLSQEELEHLAVSWMRRKQLEARLVAVEVGRLFSGEKRRHASPDDAWSEFLAATE